MTSWTLIRRSLRFHVRAHFGVVLGAAIGSAALIGALSVGDSVRGTLPERALSRLGPIHFARNTRERLFQADLQGRLGLGAQPDYFQTDGPRATALNFVGALAGKEGS